MKVKIKNIAFLAILSGITLSGSASSCMGVSDFQEQIAQGALENKKPKTEIDALAEKIRRSCKNINKLVFLDTEHFFDPEHPQNDVFEALLRKGFDTIYELPVNKTIKKNLGLLNMLNTMLASSFVEDKDIVRQQINKTQNEIKDLIRPSAHFFALIGAQNMLEEATEVDPVLWGCIFDLEEICPESELNKLASEEINWQMLNFYVKNRTTKNKLLRTIFEIKKYCNDNNSQYKDFLRLVLEQGISGYY